MFIAINMYR